MASWRNKNKLKRSMRRRKNNELKREPRPVDSQQEEPKIKSEIRGEKIEINNTFIITKLKKLF